MQQSSYSLKGVEWSGWPIGEAKQIKNNPQRAHAGYIYVIEFTDGWLKVGCASDAQRRLTSHAKDAHLRDARIGRAYISKPHAGWQDNETKLINFCAGIAAPANGREYFRGVGYNRAVQFAETLRQEFSTPEETAARERKAEALVDVAKDLWGWSGPEVPRAGGEIAVALNAHLATFMGRRLDGSYVVPRAGIDMDDPHEPEELLDLYGKLAELKGVPLQEILEMNWIEIHAAVVQETLRTQMAKFEIYARQAGHNQVLEPMGDYIFRCIEERNAIWAAEADEAEDSEPEPRSHLRMIEGGDRG